MNTTPHITRRHALQAITATTVAMATGVHRLEAAAPAAPAKPTLHVYPDYGWLRGFNYIAPWGARIEDAWWFYDGKKMREDMALARSVHANGIRLWIEFTAWFRDPEKVTANFLDAIAAIDENGMKAMPCLLNRWHNPQYDYGGTHIENLVPKLPQYRDYVRALVTPVAKDPRVFCWDLCNEPQAHGQPDFKRFSEELCQREFAWLKAIADTVRESGAQQPILIGTMNGENVTFFSPLVDVLCAHPYAHDEPGLEKLIASYKAMVAKEGKPLLCNEGVPGCDVDEVRGATHRYYWEKLSAAGFGIMPWSIREGRSIAARRDRMDGNGINRKGYHPTFNADGTLRSGHDWMREKPKLRAPWEKA
jgi:hypothetical protein